MLDTALEMLVKKIMADEVLVRTLSSVTTLTVAPGDVIVLMVEETISDEAAKHLREIFKPRFPTNALLILENGARLAVLSPIPTP